MIYTQNPQDSTKKLLQLIYSLNKPAGYKINIKKSKQTMKYQKEKLGKQDHL